MNATVSSIDRSAGTLPYLCDNPHRPVYWRWCQGAVLAIDRQRVRRGQGDRWVVLAREYQWVRQHPDTNRLDRFERWEPHVGAALEIWQGDVSLRKSIIEAAILAKEPYDAVARRFNLHADTVQAYQRLFFAVEEMLPCSGYIMREAIGQKIYGQLAADDFPLLLKLYAYGHGPGVLDALLNLYRNEIRPDRAAELGEIHADHDYDDFWLKASLAAMMLDADTRGPIETMRLWLHCRELERDADRNGGLSDTAAENIETILAEYRLAFGIKQLASAAA